MMCLASSLAIAAEEEPTSPADVNAPVAVMVDGDASDGALADLSDGKDGLGEPAKADASAKVDEPVKADEPVEPSTSGDVTVLPDSPNESQVPESASSPDPAEAEAAVQESTVGDTGNTDGSNEGKGAETGEGEGSDPNPPAAEEPAKTSIASAAISGYQAKYTYKGKAISPKVTVKVGGKTLIAGTDYRVTYTSNKKAGRAKITVTGIGMYEGAISVPFLIAKKSLKKLKIKACKRQVYTGEKLKPIPTLKHGKLLLEKGADFIVKYKANKNLGIAKMIIKGKGNYKGKVVKRFKIVPYMVVCMPERYPHRIKDVANWLGGFGIKAVLVRNADANLNRYDGMVIPGGLDDVHPQFYGEKMNGAERTDPILDRLQMKLIKRFAKTGKPILGICRGCQITNVTFGGSLYQNIGRHQGYIKTKVKKDTWLASGVGKSTTVYHYHHQAVKDLAKNFKISAWNYKGKRKVIEA